MNTNGLSFTLKDLSTAPYAWLWEDLFSQLTDAELAELTTLNLDFHIEQEEARVRDEIASRATELLYSQGFIAAWEADIESDKASEIEAAQAAYAAARDAEIARRASEPVIISSDHSTTVLNRNITASVAETSDGRYLAEIRVNDIPADGWDSHHETYGAAMLACPDLLTDYLQGCVDAAADEEEASAYRDALLALLGEEAPAPVAEVDPAELDSMLKRLIEREVLLLANELAAALIDDDVNLDGMHNDYIENEDGEEEYKEAFQWWIIDPRLAETLLEIKAMIFEAHGIYFWGKDNGMALEQDPELIAAARHILSK